jgi:hypothetical protein
MYSIQASSRKLCLHIKIDSLIFDKVMVKCALNNHENGWLFGGHF